MGERFHFVDVPVPEVAFALGGPADSPRPEVVAGHAAAGSVVGGTAGAGSVAVTALAGDVGELRQRVDAAGRARWAVPVVPDDAQPGDDFEPRPVPDVGRRDVAEWVARLADAGVRPSRHNSPDLAEQLALAASRPVDAVVCCATEADPLVPLQSQWLLRHPGDVLAGLTLLRRLTGAGRVLLAAADRDAKRIARRLRREEANDARPRVEVRPVANAYPQADPSLLAWSTLRRKLPPGRSPAESGVIVLDAVAAAAVGRIARGGRASRVPVAVRDHRPGGLAALCVMHRGQRLCDALLHLGLIDRDPDVDSDANVPTVFAGDRLRDLSVPAAAVVGDGEVVFHAEHPVIAVTPDPCVRCGWCLDICPTGVNPVGTLEASAESGPRRGRLARRHGARACIGCGLCDFVCPSRLPLRVAALAVRSEI